MATRSIVGSGVVGPNTVIQLGNALEHRLGHKTVRSVFAEGGYPDLVDNLPDRMVSEKIAAALMTSLWKVLTPAMAGAVTREAGSLTADYVITNRIPRAAKWFLAHVPAALGARLLLKSIHRNAWTFCGSGNCNIETGRTLALTLENNPIQTPGCVWHLAVLERLFHRLVSPRIAVIHAARQSRSGLVDRFEFKST